MNPSGVTVVLIALFCVLAEPGFVRAERLPVKTYTIADGLVNNRISRIGRDVRGYLWFCTENGLSRFDGFKFTNYTTEQGLPDEEVNDLLETRDGVYWIATGNGLCRYNPQGRPLFTVFRPDGERGASFIKTLYEDRSGTIWVGTWRGLYRLEQSAGQVKFQFVEMGMPVNEPQNHVVRNLLEDRQGALWLTTDSGLYRRTPDGKVNRLTRAHGFASERFLGLMEDRQGRIWVGDRYSGLCLVSADAEANKPVVARRYTIQNQLGCDRVGAMYQATDGRIWIGADCGLAEFLPQTENLSRALGRDELTDPRIWSLTEDRQGNLWVGTANGAIKISSGGFTTYTEDDGLGSRAVCSVMENRAGELCVYTTSSQQAFLNSFDGKRFNASLLKLPTQVRPDDCALCLWDHADHWWMALNGHLLRFPSALSARRLHPAAIYPGIAAQARGNIYSVYEDRRGDLWLSSGVKPRLMRWERGTAQVHEYAEAAALLPPGTAAFAYAQDRSGNVWFGFGDVGLLRYDGQHFKLFTAADQLPTRAIRSLLIDRQGRLWIGSMNDGLVRLDDPTAERPTFIKFTTAEGLSSNSVRSLVEDDWGRIYIGTDQGLNRLEPATGRMKQFTTADGLANNQVFSGYRDRHGALWFGTHTGLSRLVPEPDRQTAPPSVFINRLNIAGSAYPLSDLGETAVGDLTLSRSQSNIQIEFGGITFGAGEALRYQYRLEGADADWSALIARGAVNYANLAPGRYRFLARAINADGVASENPASFSFTILPPIWLRWWFLALAVLTLGAAGYLLYRYRVAQLLQLERMRTRIAADLHDDIGANLTRISILSEVARQQASNGAPPFTNSLQSIADIARESVTSMSDIVWAINPQRDNLLDLTRRMRQHAEEVLTSRDIALQFTAPAAAHDIKLDVHVRRDLYLIFKEAVNNAARHAQCEHVVIELRIEHGQLTLRIQDDGRGFDPAAANEGNGLLSMQRRAAALNGKLFLDGSAGDGTRLQLTIPLAMARRRG